MKIEKIIYQINKEDNVFDKCTVFYDDGTNEITSDVIVKIMDFMDQEGLSWEDAMRDSRIIDKDKITLTDKGTDRSSSHIDGVDRSSKIRKRFITITALGTAIVVGGGVLLADYILNRNKSKIFSNNNKTRVEQEVNTSDFFEIPTPMVTKTIVDVQKTDTVKDENYNETFRENVENTIEHVDSLTRNVMRLNSGERLSEEELLETINGINRLCQSNMAEVEKLIEGGSMSGDKIFPLFDEMFPEGSIENRVVSNFTSRRNELVDNAYEQDRELTINEVNQYNDYFLDFLSGEATFEHEGSRFGYYDISPIARYIVFMLGQTTLETNHNYSKDINGKTVDFMNIFNDLEENFDLIVSQLMQSGKSK